MKHFMKFMAIYALVSTVFFVGCDPEPDPEPVKDPPTITINNSELIVDSMDVDDVTFVRVNVSAEKGTGKLTQISVNEDGSPMTAFDRLGFGSISPSPDSHVYTVATTEEDSLTMDIFIKPPATVGDYTYDITVADANSKSASVSVTLHVLEISQGTPLDTLLTGVLFNREGPEGTGGINLKTGVGTGSTTAGSHLRDEGGVDPWLQKISGINGSEIRMAAAGLDFDAIDSKEGLLGIWLIGTPVDVTNKLVGGEVFVVKNGGDYFLVKIDEVVVVTSDNSDHYNMSIKY